MFDLMKSLNKYRPSGKSIAILSAILNTGPLLLRG